MRTIHPLLLSDWVKAMPLTAAAARCADLQDGGVAANTAASASNTDQLVQATTQLVTVVQEQQAVVSQAVASLQVNRERPMVQALLANACPGSVQGLLHTESSCSIFIRKSGGSHE